MSLIASTKNIRALLKGTWAFGLGASRVNGWGCVPDQGFYNPKPYKPYIPYKPYEP